MLCSTLVNCYWACELHDEYLFMKTFEIMHSQNWQHFEPYIEQVMQSKDPYIEHTSYLYIMTKPSLDFNAYSYQLQQIMSITLHNTFFCKDPVWNESDYCRNAWYSWSQNASNFRRRIHCIIWKIIALNIQQVGLNVLKELKWQSNTHCKQQMMLQTLRQILEADHKIFILMTLQHLNCK